MLFYITVIELILFWNSDDKHLKNTVISKVLWLIL